MTTPGFVADSRFKVIEFAAGVVDGRNNKSHVQSTSSIRALVKSILSDRIFFGIAHGVTF